jgi:fucose 4-O-acetylase-like acetyltransferase
MINGMAVQQRIKWIDWAKVIAIWFVVFGHTPQSKGDWLVGYVCTFHMPFFFMLSGYLSKPSANRNKKLYKYWHSLILPYLLYNILFYPYWLVRYFIGHDGTLSTFDVVVKPLMGMLFLQIDTSVSANLNGVTWFLAALLAMHIIQDVCCMSCKADRWMLFTVLVLAILHGILEYNHAVSNLFMSGLLRCFPFYIMGYFLRKESLLNKGFLSTKGWNILLWTSLSVVLYINIRLICDNLLVRILLSDAMAVVSCLAVVSICRLLDSYTSALLVNMSIGTIAIMGFHWMLIGSINFVVEQILGIRDVTYSWYIAVLLSAAICFAIYPIIVMLEKYAPFLLGKAKSLS